YRAVWQCGRGRPASAITPEYRRAECGWPARRAWWFAGFAISAAPAGRPVVATHRGSAARGGTDVLYRRCHGGWLAILAPARPSHRPVSRAVRRADTAVHGPSAAQYPRRHRRGHAHSVPAYPAVINLTAATDPAPVAGRPPAVG